MCLILRLFRPNLRHRLWMCSFTIASCTFHWFSFSPNGASMISLCAIHVANICWLEKRSKLTHRMVQRCIRPLVSVIIVIITCWVFCRRLYSRGTKCDENLVTFVLVNGQPLFTSGKHHYQKTNVNPKAFFDVKAKKLISYCILIFSRLY